jgi:hypothetical protein
MSSIQLEIMNLEELTNQMYAKFPDHLRPQLADAIIKDPESLFQDDADTSYAGRVFWIAVSPKGRHHPSWEMGGLQSILSSIIKNHTILPTEELQNTLRVNMTQMFYKHMQLLYPIEV